VQATLEVLAGRRPVQQLMTVTSETVYAALLARVGAARVPGRQRIGTLPQLRSVHVGEPADGVAEVTAVVRQGDRHRAVAVRLEGYDGRWRCTAFHVL